MNNLEYIDIKSLVKKMIEGEIQINKPLMLTSKDMTVVEEITFLSHIIKHNNVSKDTIFIFLNETLEIFNNQLLKLMTNRYVQEFIDYIKNNWSDKSDILFKNTLSEDRIELIENILKNINELCREFKELNIKIESNHVTDLLIEDELVDNIDIFLTSIEEFNNNTDEILNEINEYEKELNKINIHVLLDLSMKDKKLYLEYNNIDKDDRIPVKIQNIFLNYIYILNLIKKHIIYYRKVIDRVKEISKNMGNYSKDSKMKVKKSDNIFKIETREKEIDNYLDSIIDY